MPNALDVPCPQCHARSAQPCRSRRKRALGFERYHPGRLRLLGMTDDEIDADPRRTR